MILQLLVVILLTRSYSTVQAASIHFNTSVALECAFIYPPYSFLSPYIWDENKVPSDGDSVFLSISDFGWQITLNLSYLL